MPIRGVSLERNPIPGDISIVRRTPWFRSLAGMLAVWLPLLVGEPGVLHLCRSHDAAPVAQASAQHDAASHHASHGPSAPGDEQQACTCIGGCVGSASAAAPSAAPITAVVVDIFDAPYPRSNAESLPRLAPEYSRPYTTGPPRV